MGARCSKPGTSSAWVGGVRGLGGTMSEYEITEGRWSVGSGPRAGGRDDPTHPLTAGYLESVKDWSRYSLDIIF